MKKFLIYLLTILILSIACFSENLKVVAVNNYFPTIIQQYPEPNAKKIAVSDWITCTFSEDMEVDTLNSETIKLVQLSDKRTIPVEISYHQNLRKLTLKPKFQLQMIKNDIICVGLKPNTQYSIEFDSTKIKDLDGECLKVDSWTFTTNDLDFGIYFLGSQGEMEKWVSGRVNSYFDQTKPTVIYIPGWQKGTTIKNYKPDNAFFINTKYIDQQNTIQIWREAGWNVAVYYWSQFADEPRVRDAQAKLYQVKNGFKNMRYAYAEFSRRTNLNYQVKLKYKNYDSNLKNMSELAYQEYYETFAGYKQEIRILGHSLGNQLATLLSKTISDKITANEIDSSYMPQRLVLLDPFWSKTAEKYVNRRNVGEVCCDYLRTMIQRHGLIVEEYKSSILGGVVGDKNLELRKLVCFTRIVADFIPKMVTFREDELLSVDDHHFYAYQWYTMSLAKKIGNQEGHYLGAAATNEEIKSQSNWDYQAGKPKTSLKHFYQVQGSMTATPNDDLFKVVDGVESI